MKAIFNRIISKVHMSNTTTNYPEVQSPKRIKKAKSKDESEMGSIPSDE